MDVQPSLYCDVIAMYTRLTLRGRTQVDAQMKKLCFV